MMLRHDFHLHTRFSADSQGEPRDYCLRAIARGYRAVCFTDHADFERSDLGYGFFAYERYRRAVMAYREEFRGRLVVGLGVEIDYHHAWEDEIREFLRGKEFDYILGSVHYLDDHMLVMDGGHFAGKTQRQAYEAYFAEVLRLAESGLCQGLGHLDVIERRGAKIYGPYDASAYLDSLAPIFATAVRRGLALEINLSGYRQGLGKPSPGLDVVAFFIEAGGRLITIGSDAHAAERACPDRPAVWDFVERNALLLWEPSPGFWNGGAATTATGGASFSPITK